MTITRYVLVAPDGTEHQEEYQDPADAAEVAAILGCAVRIRHYDRRKGDRRHGERRIRASDEVLATVAFVVWLVLLLFSF